MKMKNSVAGMAMAAFIGAMGIPQTNAAETPLSTEELAAGINAAYDDHGLYVAYTMPTYAVCNENRSGQVMGYFNITYDFAKSDAAGIPGEMRAKIPHYIETQLLSNMEILLNNHDPVRVIADKAETDLVVQDYMAGFMRGLGAVHKTDISLFVRKDVIYAAGCALPEGQLKGAINLKEYFAATPAYEELRERLLKQRNPVQDSLSRISYSGPGI